LLFASKICLKSYTLALTLSRNESLFLKISSFYLFIRLLYLKNSTLINNFINFNLKAIYLYSNISRALKYPLRLPKKGQRQMPGPSEFFSKQAACSCLI